MLKLPGVLRVPGVLTMLHVSAKPRARSVVLHLILRFPAVPGDERASHVLRFSFVICGGLGLSMPILRILCTWRHP